MIKQKINIDLRIKPENEEDEMNSIVLLGFQKSETDNLDSLKPKLKTSVNLNQKFDIK